MRRILSAIALAIFAAIPAVAADNPANVVSVTEQTLAGSTNFAAMKYITTSGYYTAGDGGGGITYYNAGTTSCTANGGTIVRDKNGTGNCWYAQSFPASILQWGATAQSGKTNSTVGDSDQDAYIAAAITACESATLPGGGTKQIGCTLVFPQAPSGKAYATSGRYDLSNFNGINIRCEGSAGATMIKAIGASTSPLFSLGSAGSTLVNSGGISGCTLNANGIANYGLRIRGLQTGRFTDVRIENALLANLSLEDAPAGTSNGQTLYNTFNNLYIDTTFHSDWTGVAANATALGIALNDSTASKGCIAPQSCFFDATQTATGTTSTGGTGKDVTIQSGPTGAANVTVAVGNPVTDSAGDIPAGTFIASCSTSTCSAAGTITLNQAVTGSHSGNTLTIYSGHQNAERLAQFYQCYVLVQDLGVGVRAGYANGDTFNCRFQKRADSDATSTAVTGTNGTTTLTLPASILGGLSPLGAVVTSSPSHFAANTFITACAPSNAVCTTATINNAISGGNVDSSVSVTINGLTPSVVVSASSTGSPNWSAFGYTSTATTFSNTVTLASAIPGLKIGDAVTDLTNSSYIPSGTYVLWCNTTCGSATVITLSKPITNSITGDSIQFALGNYTVELQGTPIAVGTGDGPAWHEAFTTTQTGSGHVRCENLFGSPNQYSFPNVGICENNSFVVQNSVNGGFGRFDVDDGAFLILQRDTGIAYGEVHAGEIFMSATQANDATAHTDSEQLRSTFFGGGTNSAVTAVSEDDDDGNAVPSVSLWNGALTGNTTIDTDDSGNLGITTGTTLNETSACSDTTAPRCNTTILKVAGISECDAVNTPQYLICKQLGGSDGFVMVTVGSTGSVGDYEFYGLAKFENVTLTGVNGVYYPSNVADGSEDIATCNADVADTSKPLDELHLFLPKNNWVNGCGAGHVSTYVANTGVIYTGNVVTLPVRAVANSGGFPQYTVAGSTSLKVTVSASNPGSRCTTNGTVSTDANLEMWYVKAVTSTTITLSQNADGTGGLVPASTGVSSGVIVCQALAQPRSVLASQGVGASNYGVTTVYTSVKVNDAYKSPSATTGTASSSSGTTLNLSASTKVNLGDAIFDATTNDNTKIAANSYVTRCTGGTGVNNCNNPTSVGITPAIVADPNGHTIAFGGIVKVDLSSASPTATSAAFASGQYVALQNSKNALINGVHPVTVINTTLTLADVPYVGGAQYGYFGSAFATMTFLNPGVRVACGGSGVRAAPATVNGLSSYDLYCDGVSGKLKALKSGGTTPSQIDPVICQVATPATITGAVEQNLGSCTVPGGTMGANGCLQITAQFSYTGSTNTKTARIRFDTAAGVGGTAILQASTATSANIGAGYTFNVCNRNSVSSQIATPGSNGAFGANSNAGATPSKNTANDTVLNFTAEDASFSSPTEIVTLESYTVRVYPKD